MKILLVSPDSVQSRTSGAGLRTNSIWRALSQLGEVSVLVLKSWGTTEIDTTLRDGELGRIRINNPTVLLNTTETLKVRKLFTDLVAPEGFDLIVVRYLRLALLIRGCVMVPLVVDGDDMDKARPAIGKSFWRNCFYAGRGMARRIVTRRVLGSFEHVWYVNPRDMVKFPVQSGSILPNIIDAPVSLPTRAIAHPPTLLMVGTFGYEPNVEAADYFIREVLPSLRATLPELRFRMVGQCPPDLAAKYRAVDGIEITGFVDDLMAEYARAAAVVAPVFSGGGTQIKVLEALGHQCGTVVSAFSAAGFSPNLIAGEHMLVARNTAEWKSHCLSLINSPAHAEKLGRAGRAAVLKMYSFDGMAKEVKASLGRLRQLPQ
jgi:polysaccharide biosynthesis protein PslH